MDAASFPTGQRTELFLTFGLVPLNRRAQLYAQTTFWCSGTKADCGEDMRLSSDRT